MLLGGDGLRDQIWRPGRKLSRKSLSPDNQRSRTVIAARVRSDLGRLGVSGGDTASDARLDNVVAIGRTPLSRRRLGFVASLGWTPYSHGTIRHAALRLHRAFATPGQWGNKEECPGENRRKCWSSLHHDLVALTQNRDSSLDCQARIRFEPTATRAVTTVLLRPLDPKVPEAGSSPHGRGLGYQEKASPRLTWGPLRLTPRSTGPPKNRSSPLMVILASRHMPST